jgi:hypothetical protein
MHSCNDPLCGHDHSLKLNRAFPVSEGDARVIDEARRALAARATNTPMGPEPAFLDMATREIDPPVGERPMEVNFIAARFRTESPSARINIASYLQSRFNTAVRPKKDGSKGWRFEIVGTFHMSFQTLAITLESVRGMGDIEQLRIDGLYEHGIFLIEVDQFGHQSFRLCGDRHIEQIAQAA